MCPPGLCLLVATGAPPLRTDVLLESSSAGKKCEDLVPASHTTYAPFVKKNEYQCIDVDEDGFVTVITDSGDTRSDLKVPDCMAMPPPGASAISDQIRDLLAEERDFFVIVQSACGMEQIMDVKVMTS